MPGPEHLQNPIDGLVDRYYDQLVQQGREQAALSPAVCLTGPGSGTVLWHDGKTLFGYEVRARSAESDFPGMIQAKTRIGFTQEMQHEGVWILKKITGAPDERGNITFTTDQRSFTYAHYNVKNSQWHVTRRRGQAGKTSI